VDRRKKLFGQLLVLPRVPRCAYYINNPLAIRPLFESESSTLPTRSTQRSWWIDVRQEGPSCRNDYDNDNRAARNLLALGPTALARPHRSPLRGRGWIWRNW